jgi:hypothetical protein
MKELLNNYEIKREPGILTLKEVSKTKKIRNICIFILLASTTYLSAIFICDQFDSYVILIALTGIFLLFLLVNIVNFFLIKTFVVNEELQTLTISKSGWFSKVIKAKEVEQMRFTSVITNSRSIFLEHKEYNYIEVHFKNKKSRIIIPFRIMKKNFLRLYNELDEGRKMIELIGHYFHVVTEYSRETRFIKDYFNDISF